MLAACYKEYGDPYQVLELCEVPKVELGPQDVCIKMLACLIHPSDLEQIQGTYGCLFSLPHPKVAGKAGIGEICEIGSEVTNIKVGMRVQMPSDLGTWRTHAVTNYRNLIPIPKNLPIEWAAQSLLDPLIAWRLLMDFVPLKAGDWIIQDAADSTIGHCINQLCDLLGYKLINVVHNDHQAKQLKSLGISHVITDDDLTHLKCISNGALPKLALSSTGGEFFTFLADSLDTNGTLVCFAGDFHLPISFPSRALLLNNIQIRGFRLEVWEQLHSPAEKYDCMKRIWELLQSRQLTLSVDASFHLQDLKNGIQLAQQKKSVLFVNG